MQNYNSKLKIFKFSAIVFSLSFFAFSLTASAYAAVLYLESAEDKYYQGDNFIVEVRINTEEECINAVKADLTFSQDVLEAIDFSQGKSILTLWLEIPKIDQEKGLISFIGGIPGGFCGIVPGDIGKSNLLGSIVFQVAERELRKEREAKVRFLDSSQVLLNDGLGTPAELKTKEANFTILSESAEFLREEWKEELEKDNIPPEPFEIEIGQNAAIFEGKYFIAFHATDKQTGIDYYEIKEGKMDWKKGESPYLLKDQKLTGIIKVKAADKAGNERIAVHEARYPIKWYGQPLVWIIIILGIIIGYILWIIRKLKIRSTKS